MFENERQFVLDVPHEVGNLSNAHFVSSAHNIHNTYYTNYRALVTDIDIQEWAVVENNTDRKSLRVRGQARACMHCLLSAQLNLCARAGLPSFASIYFLWGSF